MVNENLINLTINKKQVELVQELKDYEIKTSKLSPAARARVIRKWGGGYVSENREDYGPGNEQSKAAAKEIGGVALTTLTIICPPAGLVVGSGVATAGAITAVIGAADKDPECVQDGFDIFTMGMGSVVSGKSGLKSHKGNVCSLPICPKK